MRTIDVSFLFLLTAVIGRIFSRALNAIGQVSHDSLVEAINQACPSVGDERNFPGLARLEADGRSRRNVESIPKRNLSVKGESRIGLSEMIMTADLDRSVASVRHCDRNRYP